MGSVALCRRKRRGGENVQYISTSLGNLLPMCGKRIHTEVIGTRDRVHGVRGIARNAERIEESPFHPPQ